MSIEAVLTVVTVVLAVLTLIPQERGNDIRIRLGGAPSLVFGAALALVLYWTFLEQVHALPGVRHVPRPLPWLWRWEPASLSLLTLLAAAAVAWYCFLRRLPVYRVPKLYEIASDALARRRLGECLHLLETHFDAVRRSLNGDYWLYRLRVRAWPTLAELHLKALQAPRAAPPAAEPGPVDTAVKGPDEGRDAEAWLTRVSKGALAIRQPPEPGAVRKRLTNFANRPQEAAEDLLRALSLTSAFGRELAATNPYLAVRVLPLRSSWVRDDFAETFARALLADPESIFYRELRRAENVDAHSVPVVDTREQPLLTLICRDASAADGAQFLWPFVYAGIDGLRVRGAGDLAEALNAPLGDYHERARWGSPPFGALYLLHIVVPRVAVDPHAPVLNLFVLDSFVRALLYSLAPGRDGNSADEWPTPIHYLVYECISLLVDAVNISRTRPEEIQRVLEVQRERPEPLTIPLHAANVLGSIMYHCLRSDKLTAGFKGYLLDVWWRAYGQKYRDEPWPLSGAVLEALVRAGNPGESDMAHREGLRNALGHIDHVIRYSAPAKALRERFGLSGE